MFVKMLKKIFQNHPRLSNSAVYGAFYVGAEFSQQILTRKILIESGEEKSKLDFKILGRYFVVGSIINSNYLYTWYQWLDKKYVGTQGKTICKKVLLDQFVMTPPLYVIFFVSMSLMEGRSDPLRECREKFLPTFSMSCLFWLPAQIINFMYLPTAARIVYMGICSFVWVNVLCAIKRNDSLFKFKVGNTSDD